MEEAQVKEIETMNRRDLREFRRVCKSLRLLGMTDGEIASMARSLRCLPKVFTALDALREEVRRIELAVNQNKAVNPTYGDLSKAIEELRASIQDGFPSFEIDGRTAG